MSSPRLNFAPLATTRTRCRDRSPELAGRRGERGRLRRAGHLPDCRGPRVAAIVPAETVEATERWEDLADEALAEMERTRERPIPLDKVRREFGPVTRMLSASGILGHEAGYLSGNHPRSLSRSETGSAGSAGTSGDSIELAGFRGCGGASGGHRPLNRWSR